MSTHQIAYHHAITSIPGWIPFVYYGLLILLIVVLSIARKKEGED